MLPPSPLFSPGKSVFTPVHNCSYCIENSEKADDVERRLELLSSFITEFTFNNVSRGLFEEHKLLYAFLVATSLLRHPSR